MSAAGAAPRIHLRIVASAVETLVGRELATEAPRAWIGRDPSCELVVPENSVSSRHAELEIGESGVLIVRDNKSSNHVLVGGRRVDDAEVAPGHRFSLGRTTLEVVALGDDKAIPIVDRTLASRHIAELARQIDLGLPLIEIGEDIVVGPGAPLLLDEANAMWVVVSGQVEIFSARFQDGKPHGARSHFLSMTAGQAFFGIEAERFGHAAGFLASGRAGSRLRRYSVELLPWQARYPPYRDQIGEWVAGWIQAVSRRLMRDLPAGRSPHVRLEPGRRMEVTPGQVVTIGSVAWLEMPAGNFFYNGTTGLSYEVEGLFLPLAPGGSLELLKGSPAVGLSPRPTVEVLDDARLWAGLEAFHRVLCDGELLSEEIARLADRQRLERRAEQTEQAREAALADIGSVLAGTAVWERPLASLVETEPLLAACRLVGTALGAEVRAHPNAPKDASFEDTLQALALASRLRVRRVKLGERWWRHDQGPLLGRRAESGEPVALLPCGPRSYALVDPTSGERRTLDAQRAAELEPSAHQLYRSFPEEKLGAWGLLRFGLRGLRPEMWMVGAIAFGLGLLSIVTPLITGKIFSVAIPQAERGVLAQLGAALALVALSTAAFKVTQNVAVLRVQAKMDASVQAAVWDRLLDLPLPFFRDHAAGDLADRAEGPSEIRKIVAGAGVAAILGSMASLFNVIQMAFYSLALAAIAIGLTLVYVFLNWLLGYLRLSFQRAELERTGKITGLVLQLLSGVSKIRVSGAENHAFRVWAGEFAAMRKVSLSVGRIANFVAVLNAGFPVLASLTLFLVIERLTATAVQEGNPPPLSTGDFLAFNAAFGIFLAAMQALSDASVDMLKILPIYERLRPIIEHKPEVETVRSAPGKLKGAIELAHVSFRYSPEGPWVLDDVSLEIKPGEFIALVGGSGSGKSTLMRLLLGFETPDKGTVLYDGLDLSILDLRLVRQQIGVVLQESRLFPAEIYRNIIGASSRTIKEAWEAAEMAGLDRDVRAMPMGMHTWISEGGGGLSGGQRQRLMIARALVHRPRMLFFDEATSALDNHTQQIVTSSIKGLSQGPTRVVIAHRLTTIVDADRICYLENGKIVEMGTYQELMAKGGKFAQMARRQLA